MYEEGKPAMLAFVVRFSGGRGERPRFVHAKMATPPAMMARFVPGKKQYIGQLELLAAVAVYTSLAGQLRGRRVIHMIDNQSAVAALIKGYARAPDSVNIVHAFAAFNLGLEVSPWFEWVPSKANIADLPSRGDEGLLRELGSQEVPMVLPDVRAWDEPAAAWMDPLST